VVAAKTPGLMGERPKTEELGLAAILELFRCAAENMEIAVSLPALDQRVTLGVRSEKLGAVGSPQTLGGPNRRGTQTIDRFLAECVEEATEGRVQARRMHELYCAWAKCNSLPSHSAKHIATQLKSRGLENKKSGVMYWLGVRLTKQLGHFNDQGGDQMNENRTKPHRGRR
jgi:hypothetical protein